MEHTTAVALILAMTCSLAVAGEKKSEPVPRRPVIDGEWWNVAGNPDLGHLTGEKQQPVDFGVWQAADGTWQLWSCIRHTKEPGKTRLFYGWEGRRLTDRQWKPAGIKMRSDALVGETAGGLQAPYVLRVGDVWHMFYGNYQDICMATSRDGKVFKRHLTGGLAGLFTEGPHAITRDPMVVRVGRRWHCYYCAHPQGKGGIWCRTSEDLIHWSGPTLVARGGQAGKRWWNFECPHVVHLDGYFYLFHTQRYADKPRSSVYRSRDPTAFGVDDESKFIGYLPVAAPELVLHEGQRYIAALKPGLDGIRIATLRWVEDKR